VLAGRPAGAAHIGRLASEAALALWEEKYARDVHRATFVKTQFEFLNVERVLNPDMVPLPRDLERRQKEKGKSALRSAPRPSLTIARGRVRASIWIPPVAIHMVTAVPIVTMVTIPVPG
jgi:hypothetical protein